MAGQRGDAKEEKEARARRGKDHATRRTEGPTLHDAASLAGRCTPGKGRWGVEGFCLAAASSAARGWAAEGRGGVGRKEGRDAGKRRGEGRIRFSPSRRFCVWAEDLLRAWRVDVLRVRCGCVGARRWRGWRAVLGASCRGRCCCGCFAGAAVALRVEGSGKCLLWLSRKRVETVAVSCERLCNRERFAEAGTIWREDAGHEREKEK